MFAFCSGGDKFTSGLIGNASSVVLKLGPVLLAEFGVQVIDEEPDFCRQIAPAEINRVDAGI